MTRDREPEKRDVDVQSGDYREAHVGDQGTYIEGNYYDMRGQVSRERQALPKRNKTQQALLDWVKNEVESRLKNSLHNRVSIFLEKEEDPTKVNPPWAIDVKIGTHQPFRLPSDTTISDIYDREDINGRLLILGAPGSGKTTTLLQLAQVLINRAEEDLGQPVPVLLNLSSWKDDKQTIKEWIIADLKLKYGVRKDIAQQWLENAVIIPLLDGLDELASARQSLCVEKINQFLQPSSWSSSLVVCSRSEEYQRAATKLGLNGSTILQPLNNQQIKDYLLRITPVSEISPSPRLFRRIIFLPEYDAPQTKGKQLWETIKDDPSFMNLAQTPLLLTIMVISYEKNFFEKLQKLESSQKLLSHLFDAYIKMMLDRKYEGKQPIPDETRHWLGWLAVQLEEQNQTEFLIESMRPYWLKTKKKRLIVMLIGGLIRGLIGGLIYGLIGGLIFGLNFGLIFGLIVVLIDRLIDWLDFWMTDRLIFGLLGGQIPSTIEPVETLSFSKKNLGDWLNYSLNQLCVGLLEGLSGGLIFGLIGGLIFGLIGGLIFGLIGGLIFGLIGGLIFGLIGGLIFGLIGGLIGGISGAEGNFKKYPNQGIKELVKNTIMLSITLTTMLMVIGLAIQPILDNFNLSWLNELLFVTLGVAIAFSVIISGLPAIKHFSLRVVLWFSGYIPWNYARFLDYATNRLLLQRVGGGYRFIHRLLQEHFAKTYVE